MLQFFKSLHSKSSSCRPRIGGLDWIKLNGEKACWLKRPFQAEEAHCKIVLSIIRKRHQAQVVSILLLLRSVGLRSRMT